LALVIICSSIIATTVQSDSNDSRSCIFTAREKSCHLAMTLVSDLREAPELLLDRFGGARRFVAPRPANRLLNSDGLLKPGFNVMNSETFSQPRLAKIGRIGKFRAINGKELEC
jgi:hypothetical protein